jgi:hypothetical protein
MAFLRLNKLSDRGAFQARNLFVDVLFIRRSERMEVDMGFGRGVLFWLLGVPIPIIILLALFWHH